MQTEKMKWEKRGLAPDIGYVDLKKGMGYKFIPKSASTTILSALYEMRKGYRLKDLKKGMGYKFIPKSASTTILSALHEMRNGYRFKWKRAKKAVHLWAVSQKSSLQNVNSMIVIRDPVRRFLSCYSNRVVCHRELSEDFIKKRQPLLAGRFPYDPTLPEFINNLQAYIEVKPIAYHTKPLVEHLGSLKLDFFDQVYPIEKLDDLEAYLNTLYGTNVPFKHYQASRARANKPPQASGAKIAVSELEESQLLRLFDIFDEDYQLLKGYYDKETVYQQWQSGQ